MSEENVERLRALYREWSQGHLRPGPEIYASDAMFEPIAEGREAYDAEGFQRFMREFLEQWEDFRVEIRDIQDFGDRVLVTEHQHATGKRSGIPMEMTNYAIWSFRDGLITGARWELDLDEANRAAGLID
jgi:ketosteroid isomerase-like protein